MKRVINNLGLIERIALSHLVSNPEITNYENERKIFDEIMENPKIIEEVKKNIHIKNTILEDLENFTELEKNNIYDKDLYNKIINVGEYPNNNSFKYIKE